MSYTDAEFPHLISCEDDLQELIHYYKDVREKYNGTLEQIQELSKRLDEYEKNVDSRINSAVDNAIKLYKISFEASMEAKFSQFQQNVNQQLSTMKYDIAGIDADVLSFQEYCDNRMLQNEQNTNRVYIEYSQKINADISAFMNETNATIKANNKTVSKQMCLFKKSVKNMIEELKNTLPLEVESILWLWNNVLQKFGFTALEWYKFTEISCEEWNSVDISCVSWYNNGKEIFNWYNIQTRRLSPISGELLPLYDIILELVSKLKVNALTAGEYDDLKLTAGEVNAIFATIGEYDWMGRILYNKCSTVEQEGSD